MKHSIFTDFNGTSDHYEAMLQGNDIKTLDYKYQLPYKLMEGITIEGEPIYPEGELLSNFYNLHYSIFTDGLTEYYWQNRIKNILDNKHLFINYLQNKESILILETILETYKEREKFNHNYLSKEISLTLLQEDAESLDDIMDSIALYTKTIFKENYHWDVNMLISTPIEIIIMGGAIAEINGGNPNQIIKITDLD